MTRMWRRKQRNLENQGSSKSICNEFFFSFRTAHTQRQLILEYIDMQEIKIICKISNVVLKVLPSLLFGRIKTLFSQPENQTLLSAFFFNRKNNTHSYILLNYKTIPRTIPFNSNTKQLPAFRKLIVTQRSPFILKNHIRPPWIHTHTVCCIFTKS